MSSTRPTRTPATRTSSPGDSPVTSVNVAEYVLVSPETSRFNVTYTIQVTTIAKTKKSERPINGFR